MRRVAAGEPTLSPTVTAQLIAAVAARAAARPHRGGPRPAGSAHRAGAGGRPGRRRRPHNAEIGAELYLSVATVKAHLSRVMVKLGVENRVQVAIQVHDAGLV